MSWKDYFYFTRPERYGITVLMILIVLVLIYPYFHRLFFPPEKIHFDDFIANVEKYQQLVDEYKAAQTFLEANKNLNRESITSFAPELNLSRFNPNILSREEYLEMGLPQRVANNIAAFLKAGGTFKYKEDFKRLYSVNDELYNKIEPFLDLPERPKTESFDHTTTNIANNPENSRTNITGLQNIIVDLNTSDTTELQKIRGIGPSFSRRIIAYRDLLGGYTSANQLNEVFGMDSARFNQIAPYFAIDSNHIRKININEADFSTLVRHPYIDRNQANSLISIRQRHGPYKSIDDILKSHLIDQEAFERIAPYLTVETP